MPNINRMGKNAFAKKRRKKCKSLFGLKIAMQNIYFSFSV